MEPVFSTNRQSSHSSEVDSVKEGKVSLECVGKQELNEEMSYRDTSKAVRSVMGWNHT